MKSKETLVVYFPGYKSGPTSETYISIDNKILEPTYCITYNNEDPATAERQIDDQMHKLIDENHDIFIVGSSLGGYWANFTACKYKLPCILINPCLRPDISMVQFGFTPAQLKKFKPSPTKKIPRTIFLGKNDEIIPNIFAEEMFKGDAKIVHLNEGHRLNNLKPVIKEIKFQLNNVQNF